MTKNNLILSLTLLFVPLLGFGQATVLDPATQKKLDASVAKFKAKYRAENKSCQECIKEGLDFHADTFRIERTLEYAIEAEGSTQGMNRAMREGTAAYDKLLNKYYQKLLTTLQGADKQVLVKAQKAWLAFRDGEEGLIWKLSDDKYSGGGTIQSNINAGQYYSIVEKRTVQIFNHYLRSKGM